MTSILFAVIINDSSEIANANHSYSLGNYTRELELAGSPSFQVLVQVERTMVSFNRDWFRASPGSLEVRATFNFIGNLSNLFFSLITGSFQLSRLEDMEEKTEVYVFGTGEQNRATMGSQKLGVVIGSEPTGGWTELELGSRCLFSCLNEQCSDNILSSATSDETAWVEKSLYLPWLQMP
ncbi:hypothetical protein Tco_0494159 [Tanacetum coccineum]